MSIDLILIILISRYMKKTLSSLPQDRDWQLPLRAILIAAILLFAASVAWHSPVYLQWISLAGLMAMIGLLLKFDFFKSARNILIAILPYVAVRFVSLCAKTFLPAQYTDWENIFDSAELFAIVWGFGVWLLTTKQRKELTKTRARILEQEEKNRMMTQMKAQLETQVAERTRELTKQKDQLEAALTELKATQNQLIHSEKMASLGELTAGIAHEIQNPLNFVNNFSEVNHELIEELKAELENGNQQEALQIAGNIKENEEKIIHHGKRADSIVKGMLQHSRAGSGRKEPVDINALCDEYLRLAYHGLRAKDKSFNATMNLNLDPSLTADEKGNGRIKIMGQEMGRVILNLLTNAFYAVNDRAKQLRGQDGDAVTYRPTVTVSTRRSGDRVEIRVSDNGGGVARENLEKIFQPFFTTKPSGQGTGLGLSLSYEIVTNGHGGSMSVITKNNGEVYTGENGSVRAVSYEEQPQLIRQETTGTTFIISLPIN